MTESIRDSGGGLLRKLRDLDPAERRRGARALALGAVLGAILATLARQR
jgi:hypothetical protein